MKWPTFRRNSPGAVAQKPTEVASRATTEPTTSKEAVMLLHSAGQALFSGVYRMMANEKGVRIEDMLGLLGATGGFACIVGALASDVPAGGVVVARGADGNTYYFGDAPNELLIESELSLLGLTLSAVQRHGILIASSAVEGVFRHVAATVGGSEFGIPRLPTEHTPGDLPVDYVRHLWPKVRDALDGHGVSAIDRPTVIAFAIQEAIAQGSAVLNPKIAADIVIEYAVPMARLDPRQIGN